jgi:hypothetical protein
MHSLQKYAIVLSILAVLMSSSAAQESVADLVKKSSDAVVLIVISNSAGQETALGSGFLVAADGEIVTNYHVIRDAHSAIVKLSNGAFFPVDGILAFDPNKDLAIIKVNGKNLPFLQLGDIDNLHVGDHVVAIGSPLGLEGTVSDGIVSALRDVANMKWIQTTSPVSHGNSGGPLLDMNNHVIGVITWGVNLDMGQNLNFASPCNGVQDLLTIAHQQTKPMRSVATKVEGSVADDALWTSVTSGHDYKIREDGDYLYIEWINIPPQTQTAGGFARSELKKSPDGKWRGKSHTRLPCTYKRGWGQYAQNVTNWCSREDEIEINFLSDRRIEGISVTWEKVDCKKCEAEGVDHKSFTWIPK